MKCDQCKDKLNEYIEGNLSVDMDKEIEKHLLTCESCKSIYEEDKEEYELFKNEFNFDGIEFRDSLENIMGSIDKDKYKGKRGFFIKYKKVLSGIAAMLVIAVVSIPVVSNIINQQTINPKAARISSGEVPKDNQNDVDNAYGTVLNDESGLERVYDLEIVSEDTVLKDNDNYINSDDKRFSMAIQGKGQGASEEGIGIIYIKDNDAADDLVEKYYVREDNQESPLSVYFYDNTHILIVHGHGYGTLCNGTSIIMIDLATGEQRLIAKVAEDSVERYQSVAKERDNLIINKIVYTDDSLNESVEEKEVIEDFKVNHN